MKDREIVRLTEKLEDRGNRDQWELRDTAATVIRQLMADKLALEADIIRANENTTKAQMTINQLHASGLFPEEMGGIH